MNYSKPPQGFLKLQQRQNNNIYKKRLLNKLKTFNYYFNVYSVKDISRLKTFIYFLKQKVGSVSVEGISSLEKIKSSYNPFNLDPDEEIDFNFQSQPITDKLLNALFLSYLIFLPLF